MPKNSNLLALPAMSHPVGQPFIILPTVESTNNYAMRQVQEGLASHGTAFFALEQTAGKGQRGKKWFSPPHKNIILSIVLEPLSLQAHNQFLLSASVALACYDFFSKYSGSNTCIKWPNDLYYRDRKAGGILIENKFRGDSWQSAITGIGININEGSFAESLPNAISLQEITGKEYDVEAMAKELCTAVDYRYQALLKESPATIFDAYQQIMYKRGEMARLKKENIVFDARIMGITPDGRLVTTVGEFGFGEVEWRVVSGE
jgi:BirA family biotin operon repressor/biotin-[acetyl-CoA-carboxylase] ligase